MKTRLFDLFKFAVGWPLSVLALFFIGKIIYDQAPEITPYVQNLNWALLGYGILSLLLYFFLRSLIWQRILRGFDYHVPWKESSYLWGMSELKRYVPGKVWAIFGRTVLFEKYEVAKKDIVKGMLIEVELFVIGCVIVSLLALPYFVSGFNALIGWLAIILVSLGVLLYLFSKSVIAKSGVMKQTTAVKYLLPPFRPAENLLLIVISTCALFFFGLGNYFVISSVFFLDPQLMPQFIGVFVFAFVAGFLSFITPAGLGVREGIIIFALSKVMNTGAAAFAALFSRILLIITEVLFIILSYAWLKLKGRSVTRFEKWIAAHPHETVVILLALIYTIYFTTVSFLRYEHFYAGKFDLGNMAHTVWNTSVGNIFMFTNPDSTNQVSRLAFHADFILVLLAPFYWIWPDPRMLLFIQAAVVAAGAYFVYLIAEKVLNHKIIGIVLAFAYLINPSVQRVNIYDFHAPALATTFLLGAFYFYLQKKYTWLVIFLLLAALCKEQIWAITAIFGIFLMVHHKQWIFGSAMFFISAATFYFLVSQAIPNAHGSGAHFALDYYAEFGSTPAEVIKNMILSPDKVVALFNEPEHTKYIRQLFSPLGYLSFLAPWMLIFAGPDLMINLMSNNSQLHQIYYQYTAAITPFVFIAAIYGIWLLSKFPIAKTSIGHWKLGIGYWKLLVKSILIIYILYYSLNAAYLYGPLPGAKEPNTDMFTKQEKNRELINKTLAEIPKDLKVAASNNIGAHLSDRRDIYVLPLGADQADVFVFLLTKSERGPSFEKQVELVQRLSQDQRYRVVVQKDEFTVIQKKN